MGLLLNYGNSVNYYFEVDQLGVFVGGVLDLIHPKKSQDIMKGGLIFIP